MLQQTQVKTMLPYYQRFLERFPSLALLAGADPEALLKTWEGLGYYSRVRHFQQAARLVMTRHGGEIPREPERFRALPGVGEYIAAAVQSMAFGHPLAVLDGNVKRVLSRLHCIETPVNSPAGQRRLQHAADLLLDRLNPGMHNQALMELGALVCTPRRPDCPRCPLRKDCLALARGETAAYPRRRAPRAVPERRFVMGAVLRRGRFLITRRPQKGLLGGLWQFPGREQRADAAGDESCRRDLSAATGLALTVERHLGTVRHAYTHFRLQIDLYLCRSPAGRVRLAGEAAAFRWLPLEALGDLPCGSAQRKCAALLQAVEADDPAP
jgi:A/G-specific adenine glycosylase